jgi:hypothetical protein
MKITNVMKTKTMRKVHAMAVLLALCLTMSTVSLCGVSVSAEGTEQPTVTFVAGGEVVAVVPYQAGDTSVEEPVPPVIKGNRVYDYIPGANIVLYEYVWPTYELTGEDVTVVAGYALVEYTVRFYATEDDMASGQVYDTRLFTVEDASYDIPCVPAVEGKYGTWHLAAISGDSRTVDAVAQYGDVPFAEDHDGDGNLYRLVNGVFGCDGDHNVLAQGKIHVSEGSSDYYVYVENGIPQHLGVIEEDGGLRYVNSTGRVVYNQIYYITAESTHDLLPAGYYQIDEDGFIVWDGQVKNGVVHELNGDICYYIDGEIQESVGVVQDEDGNLYYIGTGRTAAYKNWTAYYIREERVNGLIPAGYYNIGADGVVDVESGVVTVDLASLYSVSVEGMYMVNGQVVCVNQYRMAEQTVAGLAE